MGNIRVITARQFACFVPLTFIFLLEVFGNGSLIVLFCFDGIREVPTLIQHFLLGQLLRSLPIPFHVIQDTRGI